MGIVFSKYYLVFWNYYILQISAGSLDAEHLFNLLTINLNILSFHFLSAGVLTLSTWLSMVRLFRFPSVTSLNSPGSETGASPLRRVMSDNFLERPSNETYESSLNVNITRVNLGNKITVSWSLKDVPTPNDYIALFYRGVYLNWFLHFYLKV